MNDSTVIEKLIQPKPDKIILVLSEKETVSLKTACALVKFTIVSRTSITKSKDTIELLTRLIGRLDASIRSSQVINHSHNLYRSHYPITVN